MSMWSKRMGLACALAAVVANGACSESKSPNEPTPMPAMLEVTTGQTVGLPGTNLTFTLQGQPYYCPPYASCLPPPPLRLTAQVGNRPPIELTMAYAFEGPQVAQPVDGYLIRVGPWTYLPDGRARVPLFIEIAPR
jgi:hypothetical protein